MIQITKLKWRYVQDYDFYDISFELDGYAPKRICMSGSQIKSLDLGVPDAVEYLLRARLACVPERGVEKELDNR